MDKKITIEGRELTFFDSDISILRSLERENIDIEFHCRDGYCGACRCKLLKGDICYFIEPLAHVRSGEILTCCSKPLSDITVDISS
ncbi:MULTISPECIES: class I ribonucleotide reductase maintenance protein YfaE [unclassified Pseudoalteromonas]|uniref:class I ribonucleotide reductase maintenance protein YfaE n=1 Tax=unclassified Pseudoalteromonas TaxID=194690 RepID=UPI0018CFD0EE|nr:MULTISPECIES: class I ribonucleotide reductase maintenance protein YfaE [unclassified Pseudoalteromonas]MBH0039692.1 2Fe-2S ferredoxin-like protein [Pseudoalteromonas sp. SWN166]MBH0041439.1 2Fe-2S ferredoxin-like protein [Pseudoalteromonas sp. SWXJZ10B]